MKSWKSVRVLFCGNVCLDRGKNKTCGWEGLTIGVCVCGLCSVVCVLCSVCHVITPRSSPHLTALCTSSKDFDGTLHSLIYMVIDVELITMKKM